MAPALSLTLLPFTDVPVTFTVSVGNGRLAAVQGPAAATLTVHSDAQGQAAATLILGQRWAPTRAPSRPSTSSRSGMSLRSLRGDN